MSREYINVTNDELVNWIMEQPDEQPINFSQSAVHEPDECGCLFVQYARARSGGSFIDCGMRDAWDHSKRIIYDFGVRYDTWGKHHTTFGSLKKAIAFLRPLSLTGGTMTHFTLGTVVCDMHDGLPKTLETTKHIRVVVEDSTSVVLAMLNAAGIFGVYTNKHLVVVDQDIHSGDYIGVYSYDDRVFGLIQFKERT